MNLIEGNVRMEHSSWYWSLLTTEIPFPFKAVRNYFFMSFEKYFHQGILWHDLWRIFLIYISLSSLKFPLFSFRFFECKNSRCTKIKRPFPCDRYCPKITTSSVNTFLMYDDYLYTGDCQRALSLTSSNGPNEETKISPTEIWSEEKSKKMLFASCQKVEKSGGNGLR